MNNLIKVARKKANTLKTGTGAEIAAALHDLRTTCPWDTVETHEYSVTWWSSPGEGGGLSFNLPFGQVRKLVQESPDTARAYGVTISAEGISWDLI